MFQWKITLIETHMDVAALIRKDLLEPLIKALIVSDRKLKEAEVSLEKNSES